jgi:hypothetical protein
VTGQIAELQRLVEDLRARVTVLEGKLAYVSVSGRDMVISGANLYVNSGGGATDAPVNGLGNVVIGYNELRGAGDGRGGSHNLVVGRGNNYVSYGGLVVGLEGSAAAPFSTALVGDRIVLTSRNVIELTASTSVALTAGSNALVSVGDSATFITGRGFSVQAGTTLGLDATGNASLSAGGSFTLGSGGNAAVTAGGPLVFTAPAIRLN